MLRIRITLMRLWIMLVPLMRIRILLVTLTADPDPTFHFDMDPDPSFQITTENLEKVFKYILACHLQTDADPDPAHHSDTNPDPTFQFDEDPYISGSATLVKGSDSDPEHLERYRIGS
jgi:hypothetical protein